MRLVGLTQLGDSKIDNLHQAVFANDHVFRLDVPMGDSHGLRGGQAGALSGRESRHRLRQCGRFAAV